MKRTRHTAEQIISKLKTVEQLIALVKTVSHLCRVIELTPPTCHSWRQQFGGMQAEEALGACCALITPGFPPPPLNLPRYQRLQWF